MRYNMVADNPLLAQCKRVKEQWGKDDWLVVRNPDNILAGYDALRWLDWKIAELEKRNNMGFDYENELRKQSAKIQEDLLAESNEMVREYMAGSRGQEDSGNRDSNDIQTELEVTLLGQAAAFQEVILAARRWVEDITGKKGDELDEYLKTLKPGDELPED